MKYDLPASSFFSEKRKKQRKAQAANGTPGILERHDMGAVSNGIRLGRLRRPNGSDHVSVSFRGCRPETVAAVSGSRANPPASPAGDSPPRPQTRRDSILVTGAAGFIGFHLCRALLEQGKSVVGFDNLNEYYDPSLKQARLDILAAYPQFSFVRGDLADDKAVDALFDEYRPQTVYHLGAQAGVRYSIENPRAYIDSNIVGCFNILEAARRRPVAHLLFASSSSVYGDTSELPFSVDANVDRPVSLYAASKKADELMAYAYAKLYGMAVTGLRFFTVYGPFGRPDMAYFSFAKKILAGEPIDVYNHGELMRDFTYIDDVVDGLTALLDLRPAADGQGARYKLYNLGNSKPVKLGDFIQALEKAFGRTAEKRYLPMQAGDVHATCADIAESTRDFGFLPRVEIGEGLSRFADWYRGYNT